MAPVSRQATGSQATGAMGSREDLFSRSYAQRIENGGLDPSSMDLRLQRPRVLPQTALKPLIADWNSSSAGLESGSALGAFPRPQPRYWIRFLDPWVHDFYPILGFDNLIGRPQSLPVPELDKSLSPIWNKGWGPLHQNLGLPKNGDPTATDSIPHFRPSDKLESLDMNPGI